MNKKEVKNILISMRTPENEIAVNHLLGQLDMKSNTEIEQITERLGNSEQNIRKTLSKKIEEISKAKEFKEKNSKKITNKNKRKLQIIASNNWLNSGACIED